MSAYKWTFQRSAEHYQALIDQAERTGLDLDQVETWKTEKHKFEQALEHLNKHGVSGLFVAAAEVMNDEN